MPKYKLWFGISIIVALIALAAAWWSNKNSFDLLTLSSIKTAATAPAAIPPKTDATTPAAENIPKANPDKQQPNNNQASDVKLPPSSVPITAPAVPLTPPAATNYKPTPLAVALQAKASFFAERFGTYSSIRPYENLMTMKDYLTDNYWQFLSGKKNTAKPIYPAVGYIAKVVGTQVVKIDEGAGAAEINVPLVRQSFVGDAYEVGKLYNLSVVFKKINNVWLIDGASWD